MVYRVIILLWLTSLLINRSQHVAINNNFSNWELVTSGVCVYIYIYIYVHVYILVYIYTWLHSQAKSCISYCISANCMLADSYVCTDMVYVCT